MLYKLFAIFSLIAVLVNCQTNENPHRVFVEKDICKILSETELGTYNTIVKMTCSWNEFRDENNNLIGSKQMYRGSKFIYEIIFTASPRPSQLEKYKIINKGLFSNFRLKSLSFQSLSSFNLSIIKQVFLILKH
jgi:hypothetical protein